MEHTLPVDLILTLSNNQILKNMAKKNIKEVMSPKKTNVKSLLKRDSVKSSDVFVFDNEGKTADQYTIVFKKTGDVYGSSNNPFSPTGIGQSSGNVTDRMNTTFGVNWRERQDEKGLKRILKSELDNYINEARGNSEWIGKEVKDLNTLPDRVQQYIKQISAEDEEVDSSKMATGGKSGDKKYLLKSYDVMVHEDSYEEGESTEMISSWDGKEGNVYDSKEALIDAMNKIMYVENKEDEFDWESGEGTNIQTDVLVSITSQDDFYPADEKEKALWKKGKKKLYNSHYTFSVTPMFQADEYAQGGLYESGGYAKGGEIERGSASMLIDLSDGNINVFHGSDNSDVLLEIKNAPRGSWDKIWNTLRSIKGVKETGGYASGGKISDDDYFKSINHFIFFAMNYPQNFLDAWSGSIRSHLLGKFTTAYEKAGTYGAMVKFWSDLDDNNREIFAKWIKENYTGTQLAQGGYAKGGKFVKKGTKVKFRGKIGKVGDSYYNYEAGYGKLRTVEILFEDGTNDFTLADDLALKVIKEQGGYATGGLTLDQRIDKLKPGQRITISETNGGKVIAERTGDGKRLKFVRESKDGFEVIKDIEWDIHTSMATGGEVEEKKRELRREIGELEFEIEHLNVSTSRVSKLEHAKKELAKLEKSSGGSMATGGEVDEKYLFTFKQGTNLHNVEKYLKENGINSEYNNSGVIVFSFDDSSKAVSILNKSKDFRYSNIKQLSSGGSMATGGGLDEKICYEKINKIIDNSSFLKNSIINRTPSFNKLTLEVGTQSPNVTGKYKKIWIECSENKVVFTTRYSGDMDKNMIFMALWNKYVGTPYKKQQYAHHDIELEATIPIINEGDIQDLIKNLIRLVQDQFNLGQYSFGGSMATGGGVEEFNSWKDSSAYDDAINLLKAKQVNYQFWDDKDIYKWYLENTKSSGGSMARGGTAVYKMTIDDFEKQHSGYVSKDKKYRILKTSGGYNIIDDIKGEISYGGDTIQETIDNLNIERMKMSFGGSMATGGGIEEKSLSDLSEELNVWLIQNNLPKWSADEVLVEEKFNLSPKQKEYLRDFIMRWDKASSMERGGEFLTNEFIFNKGEVVDHWASDIGGSNESKDNVVNYNGKDYIVSTDAEGDVINPKYEAIEYDAESEYKTGSDVFDGRDLSSTTRLLIVPK